MINLKEIEFKILLWMQYCRLRVHSTAASWRKNNKPWKGAKGENEGRWWTSLRLALSFSRDKWLAVEKRFRLASSLNSLVLRRGDDRRRRSYEDSTLSFFSTLSLSLSLFVRLFLFFSPSENFLYRVWLRVIYDDVNRSILKLEAIVSFQKTIWILFAEIEFHLFSPFNPFLLHFFFHFSLRFCKKKRLLR